MITICCTERAYQTLLASGLVVAKNLYYFNQDLSYGSLSDIEFQLMNKDTMIDYDAFSKLVKEEVINLIYNSNNANEYCTCLYLLHTLLQYRINILDTAMEVDYAGGVLSCSESGMIPIDMFKFYLKKMHPLDTAKRTRLMEIWTTIYHENSALRYVDERKIRSVDQSFFDEKIKHDSTGYLMNRYGLSEQWITKRKYDLQQQKIK